MGMTVSDWSVSNVVKTMIFAKAVFRQKLKKQQQQQLYLSVNVFSMAVLIIEDTVNSETNIRNQTETC